MKTNIAEMRIPLFIPLEILGYLMHKTHPRGKTQPRKKQPQLVITTQFM